METARSNYVAKSMSLQQLPDRVLVYGVTGSGKSTLATRIAEVTGLPCHLLDDEIGWLPNWVERPRAEQRELATRLAASERWVFDTAYSHFRDVVLPRTQLVVALDYPRYVSLFRLLRRTARRTLTRQPSCNGNFETLRRQLSSDSIFAWHFKSFASKRRRIHEMAADPAGPPVLRMTSPRQTRRWLGSLGTGFFDLTDLRWRRVALGAPRWPRASE